MVLPSDHVPLAFDLLTEAAVNGALVATAARRIAARHELADRQVALRDALAILEHDGYLQRAEAGHTFVSHLLRDWWRGRFAFTYEPARP